MSRFRGFFEVIKIIAIVFIAAVLIRTFVFQPFVVDGSSMQPDFHDGEYLLVDKFSYRVHPPHRGDVIVFHYPRDPYVIYIKRIIGLPGETVKIQNGKVYVNGNELKEGYLQAGDQTLVNSDPTQAYQVTLDSTQFFMLGDNRQHSSDSRDWGPLTSNYIIGRTSLVLNPLSNLQAVASPSY